MDAVIVKVGGSLALQPEKLRALCAKLESLSKTHRLVVVPGGGEFADSVRTLDSRFGLMQQTSHRMALLAMNQYGLLLADLLPNALLVEKLETIQETLDSGKVPIFLPASYLFSDNVLGNTWDVTSDSITLYLAGKLHLSKTILVTDVDGIYSCDPKKFSEAKLIKKLSASNLEKMGERTSVDRYLPKLLLKSHIECFVVNGLYPQRVEAILSGKQTICSLITSKL